MCKKWWSIFYTEKLTQEVDLHGYFFQLFHFWIKDCKSTFIVKIFLYRKYQGLYKIRVKNDRKIFEIPTQRGNSAENGAGKFKIYTYVILNYILNFPASKNFPSFFTLFLYILWSNCRIYGCHLFRNQHCYNPKWSFIHVLGQSRRLSSR